MIKEMIFVIEILSDIVFRDNYDNTVKLVIANFQNLIRMEIKEPEMPLKFNDQITKWFQDIETLQFSEIAVLHEISLDIESDPDIFSY
jgi:competence transcription factor ComK